MSTRAERQRRREKQERILRLADTPQQRRVTSFHESTHAVIAELCDFPIEYVSCVPQAANARTNVKYAGIIAQARRMGCALISAGGCQLVLTDGVVPLPTPERHFFFMLGTLASLATEGRLGIPYEEIMMSCMGDIRKCEEHLNPEAPDGVKARMMLTATVLASMFVMNANIWKAIEQTALLLFQKGKIEGEEVRQIVRTVVPENLFFSKERQGSFWDECKGKDIAAALAEILVEEPAAEEEAA